MTGSAGLAAVFSCSPPHHGERVAMAVAGPVPRYEKGLGTL